MKFPVPGIATALSAAFILAVSVVASAPARAAEDDQVVATVDGEKIYLIDVKEARKTLPEQYQKVPFEMIYPALVDSIVDTKLASNNARIRNLDQTAAFKKRMRRIEDQMLQRVVLTQEMAAGITDDALEKNYAKLVKSFAEKEEVRARHILVKTEKDAKEIIEKLKGGADFAAMAKEKSTGPSGPGGGDLGFFAQGQMVPEFDKVVFDLKPGELHGDPVKTQFGWHVIKVEERRKKEVPPFEKVKEQLRAEMSQSLGAAYVEGLRDKAKIVRFTLDGSTVPDKPEKSKDETKDKKKP